MSPRVSILVWILQFMLAFAFLTAGGMKLTRSREQLAERMGWVEDFSDTMVKVIGGLEVLAGIGLIVPTLVNVAPVLAPLAAVGSCCSWSAPPSCTDDVVRPR